MGSTAQLSAESVNTVYKELTNKICNTRINEYFVAKAEIDLEKAGKAVAAEQGLRDSLKTYSAIKKR